VLAGCVTLGHGAFVGAGACILPDIEMGDWSTAGSGSVVTRNVAQGSTVVGSPARPFSKP
jgi:acetyltransferase-like isoleucine patch superfamily enzyme